MSNGPAKAREYPVIYLCWECRQKLMDIHWVGEIKEPQRHRVCFCGKSPWGWPYVHYPKKSYPPYVPRWAYEETAGIRPPEEQIAEAELAAIAAARALERRNRERSARPARGGGERRRAERGETA